MSGTGHQPSLWQEKNELVHRNNVNVYINPEFPINAIIFHLSIISLVNFQHKKKLLMFPVSSKMATCSYKILYKRDIFIVPHMKQKTTSLLDTQQIALRFFKYFISLPSSTLLSKFLTFTESLSTLPCKETVRFRIDVDSAIISPNKSSACRDRDESWKMRLNIIIINHTIFNYQCKMISCWVGWIHMGEVSSPTKMIGNETQQKGNENPSPFLIV